MQLGRGIDHPLPSSTEVKERVELYHYSISEPLCPVIRVNLPLPLPSYISVNMSHLGYCF